MSNFTAISQEIADIVTAIQQSGGDAFVQVLQYPANQFEGYPSVTVVPANVTSEYATNIENRRTYAFMVFIYNEIPEGGIASAFSVMRDLVDLVLDALDKSIDLNNKVDFLIPTPMEWVVENTNAGATLIAPIRVIGQKDIRITNTLP